MVSHANAESAKPCYWGSEACSTGFLFGKKSEIWCILVHSRAHFSLHCFAIFEVFFFNVAVADKSEKKNLKCDLMVLRAVLTSAGTVLIPFWLQGKNPAGLELLA